MPGAISIFFLDLATLTVFWRGASGHENSLFECLDDYNSRFWSSNDDSCTLLQGRFATPFFSWCSFVKTLGLAAERANSRVDLQPLRCFGGVRQKVVQSGLESPRALPTRSSIGAKIKVVRRAHRPHVARSGRTLRSSRKLTFLVFPLCCGQILEFK